MSQPQSECICDIPECWGCTCPVHGTKCQAEGPGHRSRSAWKKKGASR